VKIKFFYHSHSSRAGQSEKNKGFGKKHRAFYPGIFGARDRIGTKAQESPSKLLTQRDLEVPLHPPSIKKCKNI
jgi:hypothetical protein